MRQLTLNDVVIAGQEGKQFQQQQRQVQRAEREQQRADEADKAFAQAIEAGRQRHIQAGGDPNAWRPGDMDMLRGVQARGEALARAGNWRGFFENLAAADSQVRRITANALRDFESHKDPARFARAFYPTIFDGREITNAELVQGGPEGAPKGAPSGPTMLRVTLENGETRMVDPVKMIEGAALSLRDPIKAIEDRAQIALKTALADIDAGKQIRVAEKKHQFTLGEIDARAGRSMEEARFREEQANRRNTTSSGATLEAARIRSSGGGGGDNDGGPNARLQSTKVDANGNLVGVFRDGSTRPLRLPDGSPVRAADFNKRVDAVAARIMDGHNRNPSNMANPMSMKQARDEARRLLMDEVDEGPSPAPAAAPATQQPANVLRFDRNGNIIR